MTDFSFLNELEGLVILDLHLLRADEVDDVFDSEVPWGIHYSLPSVQSKTEQKKCHLPLCGGGLHKSHSLRLIFKVWHQSGNDWTVLYQQIPSK